MTSLRQSQLTWLLPSRFCSSLAEADLRLEKVSAFFTVFSDMFLGCSVVSTFIFQTDFFCGTDHKSL